MDSVYLETTLIGNIAGRLHSDTKIAARKQVTREGRTTVPDRYNLYVSEITIEECGDPDAAKERLDLVRNIEMSPEAEELAELQTNLKSGRGFVFGRTRPEIFHRSFFDS